MRKIIKRQAGLTLIELLVAMTISMVIVVAAAYVYLASRESQRAIDRNSTSRETGVYVMQLLGREIMNAGFYPATVAPFPQTPLNRACTIPIRLCHTIRARSQTGKIQLPTGHLLHSNLEFMDVVVGGLTSQTALAQLRARQLRTP